MPQAETLGEQTILRVDHVGVIVCGEFRFKTIRRLCAFAVTDAVGNDDVIFGGVEWLAWAEKLTGEISRKHAGGRAGGAMQHQHRLPGRLADRGVVQPQLGQHFASVKLKVARDPVGLLWRGIICSEC